ncbi:MAG: glycosyltransferase [Solirubrobacterales bacterium]|nr:glycosyltransferase [Solirubrobacterales bacterium]
MRVLTLATPASLSRARALGRSLRRHQPDWDHEVLMIGRDGSSATPADEGALHVGSVCRELDLDIEPLLALHDEGDLSALLLPSLLARYSQRTSEAVLHLPSTVWVLGDLEPIAATLSSHHVLLVPRLSTDLPDDGLQPTAAQLEAAGRIEETIMAVDPSSEAQRFLAWWGERVELMLGSLDARRSGARPEDRPWLGRFLELAPARFATGVLDDPGCNLNMWNLHQRDLHATASGVRVDGRWPLRFMNLPGFEPERPHRLNSAASRARVSRSPILHELSERYAEELRESGWRDSDHRADVGRRLADGLVYDDSLRSVYASALALGESFPDLFTDQGTGLFLRWLEGPAPRGAVHGINRYVFYRVARERPDVVRAYPDADGPDGEEYVAWCWAFGRDELSIPDRFMPPRPGEAQSNSSQADSQAEPRSSQAEREPARNRHDGAANRLAVRLTGYLGHTLGLGAAARGYAQALTAAGVPVSTVTVPLHHLALPVELEAGYGRHGFEDLVHQGAHGFEIVAVNADELPDFVTRLGESYFEGPRIGIWGWETNSIPPRWQRAFALVDEIWVYSRFMAENIGAVAPVPVVVLPPPVDPPKDLVKPVRLGVPEGFLFLFLFDYLSTVQRKNPVGLIEAFRHAFPAGDGPQLLIKTINAPLRPLAEEEVLWAAHGRPDIHVVDRSLSAKELSGLMAACDCYVSLHRAEGFGLTMAEAMAIGKPVIATGYSGNVDFMNSENSYLIDYSIGRVGAECEIYPPDGEWADPRVEHAAELMRRVYENQEDARRLGARAAQEIAAKLSSVVTGAAMRTRLEELAGSSSAGRREPGAAQPIA